MGYFDIFKNRRKPQPSSPAPQPPAAPESKAANGGDSPAQLSTPSPVGPRLAQARACLEARDLPAALALYEAILADAGDRADVLVAISGDLGVHGHVREIIELVAPRYDAQRHGPATGLNVLQAYLSVRDADSAQHVLDLLFALNRPELEERLHGFSNVIAEILHNPAGAQVPLPPGGGVATTQGDNRIHMVTISKPIWFYGFENMLQDILPQKGGRLRTVAFAQLATPGLEDWMATARKPEDELGRLCRSIPLLLAEALYFSPLYQPLAAVGVMDDAEAGRHYALFPSEWAIDQVRQLVESASEPIDYVVTGAIQQSAGDYEMVLKLWEVKTFRERKRFQLRWTPATADKELAAFVEMLCLFMEAAAPYPAGNGVPYTRSRRPSAWLDVLGASLGQFLMEKQVVPAAGQCPLDPTLERLAGMAADGPVESLAWLSLVKRAQRLGMPVAREATLATHPIVQKAAGL